MKNTCDFWDIKKNMLKMMRGLNTATRLFQQYDAGLNIQLEHISDELEQACAAAKAIVGYSSSIHFDYKRDAYYCEKCCDAGDENSTLKCSFRSLEEHEDVIMNYDEMIADLTILAFRARDKGVPLLYCTKQLIEDCNQFEMH